MRHTLHEAHVLLLDLDGTLADTLPVMRRAWAAVREQHGVEVPFADYQRHLGRPFEEILQLIGVGPAEEVHATYDAAAVVGSGLATMFEGIEEVLLTLASRGWLLGVVTSKPLHRAAPLLARIGTPLAVVRTPGTGRGKPAPDPLLSAVLELGVDPDQAVYVGDMAVDQESADRAGLHFIHAAWGYGVQSTSALAARTPGDLLRLLSRAELRPAVPGRAG